MAYQTNNPYTEVLEETFLEHTDQQLVKIIANAEDVYANDWRHRIYRDRATIIRKVGSLLRENKNELAKLATIEMGKLVIEAEREVSLCADIFDYYADNAEKFLGTKSIDTKRGNAYVEISPLGIIFCIEPWNFPYYQLARVAAPNLMAGNALIVKHAPSVPQCALAFEKLIIDAGAPAGLYSNVFISNEQSASAINDQRIKGVALTGSERAGSAVAAEAGKVLKKSTMELGGSDAFIVLKDADMDLAVKLAVSGRMTNNGQVCDGAKRFILADEIAEEFVNRFKIELSKLVAGDPLSAETTLAPLCSAPAIDLAVQQIATAVENGAKVIFGGKRMNRTGYFLEPTLLENVLPTNPVFYKEFFAPVAMIFKVATEQEAIDLANDSPYGLGGTIVTRDIARGKLLARQIETGMVFINSPAISSPEFPFGGIKNSGYGRELSDLGISEFINKKLIVA